MQFLIPESGLLFWMLLSFGVVVFVLVKFGFPIILKMVDERKTYIEESLLVAKQNYEQMEIIKAQGEAIVDEARREQSKILKDASLTRDQLIKDAKEKALLEANKIIDDARIQIQAEKDDAIRDIRRQVALLSVDIAEKVIRVQLSKDESQTEMINRLIDEISISKS